MRRPTLFAALLAATACTTPDVSPGIKDARSLLADTAKGMRKDLETPARAEFLAAQNALVQQRRPVVRTAGPCAVAAARIEGISTAGCQLVEFADPTGGPVNASQVLAAMDALDDYWTVLAALADAGSRAEIDVLTKGLLDGIAGLANDQPSEALAHLAGRVTERRDLIQKVAGGVLDQHRYRALRRAVVRADPIIGAQTKLIASYYEQRSGNALDASDALTDASNRMEAARTQGTPAQYRAAIADYRRAFAAMKKAEARSPVNRLFALRQMHAALRDQLQSPSLDDYLTSVEQVREIIALTAK